jgi:hypothetical protein
MISVSIDPDSSAFIAPGSELSVIWANYTKKGGTRPPFGNTCNVIRPV